MFISSFSTICKHQLNKASYALLLLSMLCSLISACASKPEPAALPPAALNDLKLQAENQQTSVADLIAQYETKIKTYDAQHLAFYAPESFSAAQKAFSKADDLTRQSPELLNETKLSLLTALRFLDQAQRNKKAVELHLKAANAHYHELLKLNAHELVADEFKLAAESFKVLISLVEQQEIQRAISEQADLIEAMLAVEINTLKLSHLGEAKAYLQKALEHKAKKYAPQSYLTANDKIAKAAAFIEKKYRDRAAIELQAAEALQAAMRCYYVAQESEQLDQLSPADLEQAVLTNFALLDTIYRDTGTEALELDDYSRMSTALLTHIKQYQDETTQLKTAYESLLVEQAKLSERLKQAQAQQHIIENSEAQVGIAKETSKKVLSGMVNEGKSNISNEFEADEQSFDSIEFMQK